VRRRSFKRFLAERQSDSCQPADVAKLRYENLRNGLLQDYRINGRKSLYRPANNGDPYLTSLKHLDRFFAGRKVGVIARHEIRRFVIERQTAGVSNGTINSSLAALKRMFSLAIRDGTLQTAPHFEMLKEAAPRRGFLEADDFKRLRMELPEHLRSGHKTRAVFERYNITSKRDLKEAGQKLSAYLKAQGQARSPENDESLMKVQGPGRSSVL
jgi:hypothetical protein